MGPELEAKIQFKGSMFHECCQHDRPINHKHEGHIQSGLGTK